MINNKKSAVVTGANRGLGYQIVKDLLKKNFYVYLTARNTEKGKKAMDDIGSPNCEFLQMDVSNFESIKETFTIISEKEKSIEVIVNNAGIMPDNKVSIIDTGKKTIENIINTNALGALYVVQIFYPLLKEGSRIINISSGLGSICNGMQDYASLYSISKCTLNAITCQLAYALKKDGISINAMCPGWVRTDMGGKNASRSIEKGVETALWLATEAADNITGKIFRDKKEISY